MTSDSGSASTSVTSGLIGAQSQAGGSRLTALLRGGIRISIGGPEISRKMKLLLLARQYERAEQKLLKRWLTPEDAVIECGSAIGYLSLYCLKRLGISHYAMMEPNADLHGLIERNFSLNGIPMSAVTFLGAAVADRDGDVTFDIAPDFWASGYNKSGPKRSVSVRAMSLPTILAQLSFTPTTLVMDIEGGEADIPADHFAPFRKIVVETHPSQMGRHRVAEFTSEVRKRGFKIADRIGDSYVFTR